MPKGFVEYDQQEINLMTPDLSDASCYGSPEVVFEPDDNPQVCSISNDNESKKDYERFSQMTTISARRRRSNLISG